MNPREDAEKVWLTNGADAGIPLKLVGGVGGKREKNRKEEKQEKQVAVSAVYSGGRRDNN